MRLLISAVIVLFSLVLQAKTEGRFWGQQYMINMASASYDGTVDTTPFMLYEKMNVAGQPGLVGTGKVLDLPQKEMSFICSKQKENDYHCSFIIFNSAYSKINLSSAQIIYTAEKAQQVYQQFFPNEDGSDLNFQDETGQLNILVSPNLFKLTFKSH